MSSLILHIITITLAIWLASTHYTNTHNKRYATVRLSKDNVLKHNKLISLFRLPHEWITLIILIIQTSMSVLILLSISSDMKIESSIFSSDMLLILDVVIMCIIPTLVLFTLLDVSNMAYNLSSSSDTEHFEAAPSNSLVLAHGVCLMIIILAISMDMMLNSITITQALCKIPVYDITSKSIMLGVIGLDTVTLCIAIADVASYHRNKKFNKSSTS